MTALRNAITSLVVGSAAALFGCGEDLVERAVIVSVPAEQACPTVDELGIGHSEAEDGDEGLTSRVLARGPRTICWYRQAPQKWETPCVDEAPADPLESLYRLNRAAELAAATDPSPVRGDPAATRVYSTIQSCDADGLLYGWAFDAEATSIDEAVNAKAAECPTIAPATEEVRSRLGISTLVGADHHPGRVACSYKVMRPRGMGGTGCGGDLGFAP